MKHANQRSKPLLLAAVLLISITIIAWKGEDSTQQKNIGKNYTNGGDTTKPRQRSTDVSKPVLDEMDKAMKQVDEELKKLDLEMKKMDFSKIGKEIKDAIATIDFDKIGKDVDAAIKKIDWDKIHVEVNNALKEAQLNMKELDNEKLKETLGKVKEQLSKENFDVDKIKQQVDKGMQQAKKEMAKAKVNMEKVKGEMKISEDFINALEKDGLINKKKGYKIAVENGELFINGTKQQNEVYEKYKEYYLKEKFTLNLDGNETISL